MRTLIKYISLLLFSGLIIPFYSITFNVANPPPANSTALISADSNHTLGQAVIIDIAKNIFPALKSLISL
ncbi:hypothetical protein [Mucilaginibacter sp.]|uniref:hypothetical protein n=1 Tax=Mucilaginibacter sp. TaxID=1882438 RepID=UPI0025F1BC24|nr:hypothetical protein [Mucilaginibacter sp.]